MQVTQLTIANYRSFGPSGETIAFPAVVTALVGKNNAGKSNIIRALEILLGSKSLFATKFADDEFHDSTRPIELSLTLGNIEPSDKTGLFTLGLTKQQAGALSAKLSKSEQVEVTIKFRRHAEGNQPVQDTDEEVEGDLFDINLWGFQVFKKKDEARRKLVRLIAVPAVRKTEDDLSASQWTVYGQLMKETLQSSPGYEAISNDLDSLNKKIQAAFVGIKKRLVAGAKTTAYVDDVAFQLTKDGSPTELLRNLQVLVKEQTKWINLANTGTGTQSAVIIGILEMALKARSSAHRVFCIEEPEAFIHPHGIRYLGDLIKFVPKTGNTQVVLSTHSPTLLCSFSPEQIIRVDKVNGTTKIHQSATVTTHHMKRFIHQDNADLFFSDRVVFVEGPTERVLLTTLDKETPVTRVNPNIRCNFNRKNIGIVRLDPKDSLLNYSSIAQAFGISYGAILDNDFLMSRTCQTLCCQLGVSYQTTNVGQLIADLRQHRIIVVSNGEIEDIFPDSDVAAAAGKTLAEVQSAKSRHSGKTSGAFRQIFGCGKHEYAIRLADYYASKHSHPLEDTIRKIYQDQVETISL